MPIALYDTTLRDGTQREGFSLSVDDKLRICQRLDDLGVRYIEGGWPGANPKDTEFFRRAADLSLAQATITAFGSTRRKERPVEDDAQVAGLLETQAQALCVFGKAWDVHVTEALKTTLDENLAMVADTVRYLKEAGRTVFFDAEHFFDGYAADPDYALEVCRAAAEAGADVVVLCDTNGGTLPQDVGRIVREAASALDVPLGIHAHNDAGCGVANSIIAVEAGCTHVQGTINGYGERAGNADLTAIIPALKLKMGLDVVSDEQLRLLTEVSHFVAETANISPFPHQPYVGHSAFAHKGGVHTSAAARLKNAYEHIAPEAVGNIARVLVSEMAGKTALVQKAKELGCDVEHDPELLEGVLAEVKEREFHGYSYEAADGSLEILIRRKKGDWEPFFRLESFRVIADKREDGRVMTEATVKVHVGDERFVEVAEGNGPVNALDRALRQALEKFYPDLARIELADYKVRVLDEKKGTGAVTRVLITSHDGEKDWGTVGVSENIIEASWEALVDSIEWGLSHPPKE